MPILALINASTPAEVKVQPNQVVLSTLPKEHVGLDHQLECSSSMGWHPGAPQSLCLCTNLMPKTPVSSMVLLDCRSTVKLLIT